MQCHANQFNSTMVITACGKLLIFPNKRHINAFSLKNVFEKLRTLGGFFVSKTLEETGNNALCSEVYMEIALKISLISALLDHLDQ